MRLDRPFRLSRYSPTPRAAGRKVEPSFTTFLTRTVPLLEEGNSRSG